MKRYLIITALALGLAVIFAGCGLTPVPRTTFKASIGGQEFAYSNPKQAIASNIVFEVVSTNGAKASMTIGSLSSVNDPAVVDKSYAGQAAVINALGTQFNNALQTGAALAGSAAKAP